MRRVCIIGGTGFIGHHLVDQLIRSDREVTVIGRNPHPTRELPDGVLYISGDYGDRFFLRGVLQNMDEVIALAHSTVPKTSFEDPVNDILTNLPAAVNLFDISACCNIKKLVFVSSGGTIYGKTSNLPIDEEHSKNPISPYGITKLAIEKYATMFGELKDLPFVCVRPSNAYGAGQRPYAGQGFIATAIASILEGHEVVMFGETGTVRDYIYVTDVAGGILAALEHGRVGTCYNIASGIGRSNRDILNALIPLAQSAGFSPRIQTVPSRRFDVPANVLNPGKIIKDTGWEIRVPFETGIKKTWNWLTANL